MYLNINYTISFACVKKEEKPKPNMRQEESINGTYLKQQANAIQLKHQ